MTHHTLRKDDDPVRHCGLDAPYEWTDCDPDLLLDLGDRMTVNERLIGHERETAALVRGVWHP